MYDINLFGKFFMKVILRDFFMLFIVVDVSKLKYISCYMKFW